MRDYGKVHTSFWTSQTTREMSEDARSLAMYLLTCPHGTISGVFRLPDGYVCDDIQWCSERVNQGFIELLNKGFANRCETTKWVWINKHFEWNKPENPNQLKSAAKIALSIPDTCCWKADYMRLHADFLGIEFEPFPNPLPTVPEPVAVTVTVVGTEAVTVTEAVEVAADEPAAAKKKKVSGTGETWMAYSEAYFNRYGTEPVRNATVSSQIVQFVKRIGETESPHVAAFFLTHNDAFYVKQMHAVGLLLKDAEKLRTEWATQSQMTHTKAMQVDKTQTNLDSFAPLIAEAKAREAEQCRQAN